MSAKLSVGYVGAGLMGGTMLERLVSLGYRVQAFDIDAARLAAAHRAGACPVESAADAARDADFVLLNLPSAQAVETAVFGTTGLATALRPPQLVVDFSTIPAAECRDFSRRLHANTGCNWVDVPVSGGPPAAAAGSLTIMAGGAETDIARLRPLMNDVGRQSPMLVRSARGRSPKRSRNSSCIQPMWFLRRRPASPRRPGSAPPSCQAACAGDTRTAS
jgi:3-hydroxyisobutyrate dehydrogenase-like beta-hydroxyacid dehydrogenase